jgi:hypothetical protein
MNTAEKWLSLHHPALERATPIYRRICPLSSGPSELNSTVPGTKQSQKDRTSGGPASFSLCWDVKDDRRGEAQPGDARQRHHTAVADESTRVANGMMTSPCRSTRSPTAATISSAPLTSPPR